MKIEEFVKQYGDIKMEFKCFNGTTFYYDSVDSEIKVCATFEVNMPYETTSCSRNETIRSLYRENFSFEINGETID